MRIKCYDFSVKVGIGDLWKNESSITDILVSSYLLISDLVNFSTNFLHSQNFSVKSYEKIILRQEHENEEKDICEYLSLFWCLLCFLLFLVELNIKPQITEDYYSDSPNL